MPTHRVPISHVTESVSRRGMALRRTFVMRSSMRLEQFPADRTLVRVAKLRQNNNVELVSDSTGSETALPRQCSARAASGRIAIDRPWRTCLAALVLAAVLLFHHPAEADPAQVCEREMIRAARAHGVPLAVLYAIGMTETGRRGSLHPYALNIEGTSFFPATLAEAVDRLAEARSRGAKLIDVGCMQINYHYHGEHFAAPEAMFDPRANVTYAARFLKQLEAREGSWTLAAARYHAGPTNTPAQKRYVCQVIANMVASGFGSWTASARAFCR